ncbi:DoxX family protein [Mucilaginibacter litoreus]|uniref:DoxX family protein n=2 Tax=Mucilaginibacter litoreus TaxID=1048221 RepID=A0ABW3AQC2_9SPHI
MKLSSSLDSLHAKAKSNIWLKYFAVFLRIALAAGFFPSGLVKVLGERFTSLSNNHPMGHYLEALFHTGYYYTFIGVLQMTAAVLLLIPRTALLGALLYFPIILNICILSLSVRFDGSLITSPLMVLGNLYLLCWDYDRLKFILPYQRHQFIRSRQIVDRKFPKVFFAVIMITIIALIFTLRNVYSIMPRNTINDCRAQCKTSKNEDVCKVFCDCIHSKGEPLDKALEQYNKAVNSLNHK